MINTSFYLKEPNGDSETLLYIFASFDGKRIKKSTGIKVKPGDWNSEKSFIKRSGKWKHTADKTNAFLKGLQDALHNAYYEDRKAGTTADALREALDIQLGNKEAEQEEARVTFLEYLDAFIEKRDASPKYTKGSIQVYRSCAKHVKAFAKKRGGFDFDDIDLELLTDFRDYLYAKDFSENYTHKVISTLKTVLNQATEEEFNTNLKYKTRKLGVSKPKVQKIYSTVDELTHLYGLKLSGPLEKVRDLYLVGAFTGLRYSDFRQIKRENFRNIEGKTFLDITTQKTLQRVVIPLHPIVNNLVEKYDGKLPKAYSNQVMNRYLKDLGQVAEMDEKVQIKKLQGGQKKAETFAKWQLLTTHTARRSFATNAYKAGVPTIAIRAITGHRTEEAFMRYIQVSEEENALLMAKNPFFSPLRKVL